MLVEDRVHRMGAIERFFNPLLEKLRPPVREACPSDWRSYLDASWPDLSNIESDGAKVLLCLLERTEAKLDMLVAMTRMTSACIMTSLAEMVNRFGDCLIVRVSGDRYRSLKDVLSCHEPVAISAVSLKLAPYSETLREMLTYYNLKPGMVPGPKRSTLAANLTRLARGGFEKLRQISGMMLYEDSGHYKDLRLSFVPIEIHGTKSILMTCSLEDGLSTDVAGKVIKTCLDRALASSALTIGELQQNPDQNSVSLYERSGAGSKELVLEIGGRDGGEVARNVDGILRGLLREHLLRLVRWEGRVSLG